MADVTLVTMSEFGRTVRENGNRGTDHGHANCMLVLGGGVRGGKVYGRWPGLDASHLYENRDLAVTTDFRDVFAEILADGWASPTSPRFSRATTAPRPSGSASSAETIGVQIADFDSSRRDRWVGLFLRPGADTAAASPAAQNCRAPSGNGDRRHGAGTPAGRRRSRRRPR